MALALLLIVLTINLIINVDSSLCWEYVNIVVRGQVTCLESGEPIRGARVFAFNRIGKKSIFESTTDENGMYYLNLTISIWDLYLWENFFVAAYYDDPKTPGADYVPQYVMLSVRFSELKTFEVNFSLHPGATIVCDGSLLYVNYSEPASKVMFMIVDERGMPLRLNNSLTVYGDAEDSDLRLLLKYLGLPRNVIIVPAEMRVKIFAVGFFVETLIVPGMYLWWSREVERVVYRKITIPLFEDDLTLNQGDVVNASLLFASARYALQCVESTLSLAKDKVEAAGEGGYYTSYLIGQVNRAEDLISRAKEFFKEGFYLQAYSDAKEANLLLENVVSYVDWMIKEAGRSLTFLILFFCLASVILSLVLTEKAVFKVVFSPIFSAGLMAFLYRFFPGSKNIFSMIFAVAASLVLVLILVLFDKFTFKYAVASGLANLVDLISVAKRNLRRRKLRTLLILISLIAFTAGGVALTSISFELGILSSSRPNEIGALGISFERYVPMGFTVLGFSDFDAEQNPYGLPPNIKLLEMANLTGKITLVTWRAESRAKVRALGRLVPLGNYLLKIDIFGIVCLSSDLDPMYVPLKNCLVKGDLPAGPEEIAISLQAAQKLGVDVGRKLIFRGRAYVLSGIFDDAKLESLRELSGRPFLPFKMVLELKGEDGNPSIYASRVCRAREVIILHGDEAEGLGLFATRYFIYLNCSEDELISIGKLIAFRGGEHVVTVFMSDQVVNMLLARYFEMRGFEAVIPMVLVVFNAAISSLAALHERRRETATISAVGATPSKLLSIFLFESIVLGFIGGSLGYALGLSLYELMRLTSNIEVKPKISFVWVLVTSLTATIGMLVASLLTLRSTLIVVPSKLWRIKAVREARGREDFWIFEVPIKLEASSAQDFAKYMYSRLCSYPSRADESLRVRKFTSEEIDGERVWKIVFTYDTGSGSFSKNSSRCFLEIRANHDCRVMLKVKSYGSNPKVHAYHVAKIVRGYALGWK